jgi:hypothetical protein
MIDLVAQVVAQFAANAGLVAIAKINMNDIERMYLSIFELYHSIIVSTSHTWLDFTQNIS